MSLAPLDPAQAAAAAYRFAVATTGFDPPANYADLLLFVELSGAPVQWCQIAPKGFDGIHIGDWIHVNGGDHLTDRQRMLILAHEWCHWLRRCCPTASHERRQIRLYRGGDAEQDALREYEEQVAKSFERLF